MLTVHTLAFDRISMVAAQLCAADRAELDAAGIDDVISMLGASVPDCAWVEEARWDGHPIAIFGVRPLPGGEVGAPWMLTTTHMEQAQRRAVAKQARRSVDRMRADFPRLLNVIHAENRRAIRFVQWLGFVVGTEPTGPGLNFRLFWWNRDV